MKYRTFYLSWLFAYPFLMGAQPVTGAWKQAVNDNSEVIKIYSAGNYFMCGARNAEGRFLFAYGGRYFLQAEKYTETYDFHSADSSRVGTTGSFALRLAANKLEVLNSDGAGGRSMDTCR